MIEIVDSDVFEKEGKSYLDFALPYSTNYHSPNKKGSNEDHLENDSSEENLIIPHNSYHFFIN